jgi:superfamily II DNA/RNA helicase
MFVVTKKIVMKAFQEFTFIDPVLSTEVMVNINTDHKIVDCYTYKSDVNDIPFSAEWEEGRNPLFVHNKDQFRNIAMFFVVFAKTEEEVDFLHTTMRKNKIEHYEIVDDF